MRVTIERVKASWTRQRWKETDRRKRREYEEKERERERMGNAAVMLLPLLPLPPMSAPRCRGMRNSPFSFLLFFSFDRRFAISIVYDSPIRSRNREGNYDSLLYRVSPVCLPSLVPLSSSLRGKGNSGKTSRECSPRAGNDGGNLTR